MLEQVRQVVASLEVMLRDFDPPSLDASGAVRLVQLFARIEHLGAAGKALAAGRVEETGAWRASGERSAADYVALKTGVNVGAAVQMLETVKQLDGLPATSDAFRAGKLSEAQAHEITGAASKDPSAEQSLLDAARSSKMKGLKDRCRRVRVWCSRGVIGSTVRHPAPSPHLRDGRAPGSCALRAQSAARRRGLDLLRRTGSSGGIDRSACASRAPRTSVVCRCDDPAEEESRREVTETRGPRPRAERSEASRGSDTGRRPTQQGRRSGTTNSTRPADAKVREVSRDGAELPEYSTEKRYYPAWLTAWLDAKYPVCGVEGCDSDFRLQYDHVVGLEQGGRTERDNLWRLCPHHHKLKTNAGWRVTGTTHAWDLEPPNVLTDPDPP